jgi:hypothetical protein
MGTANPPVVTTGTSNPAYAAHVNKEEGGTFQYQSISCIPAYAGYCFQVSSFPLLYPYRWSYLSLSRNCAFKTINRVGKQPVLVRQLHSARPLQPLVVLSLQPLAQVSLGPPSLSRRRPQRSVRHQLPQPQVLVLLVLPPHNLPVLKPLEACLVVARPLGQPPPSQRRRPRSVPLARHNKISNSPNSKPLVSLVVVARLLATQQINQPLLSVRLVAQVRRHVSHFTSSNTRSGTTTAAPAATGAFGNFGATSTQQPAQAGGLFGQPQNQGTTGAFGNFGTGATLVLPKIMLTFT